VPAIGSGSFWALSVMNDAAQAASNKRVSRFFWIGLLLLCLGTGPLLIVVLAAQFGLTRDPNPNPIGFGILAFFTFWPSVLLIVIGIVHTRRTRRDLQAK
jgi:hypothetical protein